MTPLLIYLDANIHPLVIPILALCGAVMPLILVVFVIGYSERE